jgi:aspartate kinase
MIGTMSSLIVLKFGGTSVATTDLIKNAALHIQREIRQGNRVVVVVSAMAGVTNQLISWSQEVAGPQASIQPDYDTVLSAGEQVTSGLLSLALGRLGMEARSWQGWQVPIQTDGSHGYARIVGIETKDLLEALEKGQVPVVSGFQGVSPQGQVTTLGRGGSDTSAVALAAALKASRCDIYTDVEGVYTADPRIVPKAKKLEKITYEEMLELASQGAKVLQTRSVELAMKQGVTVRVLSSFAPGAGTLIINEDQLMEQERISGLAYSRDEARLTLTHIPRDKGALALVLKLLSQAHIPMDMIVQNGVAGGGIAPGGVDLTFTVPSPRLQEAIALLEKNQEALGFNQLTYDEEISKVSIVGVGLRSHAQVMERMLKILHDQNIDPFLLVTSEIKISLLIPRLYLELAMRTLHSAYGLDAIPTLAV